MQKLIALLTALILPALTLPGPAHATDTITVKEAWVRAPAPGAQVTAAYMTLEVAEPATLVSASSPAAKAVEIHTMSMKNGVMEMRQLKALELKPGQPVKLQPGGLHLMLIDLTKPLKAGDNVDVALHFGDGKEAKFTKPLSIPVKIAP